MNKKKIITSAAIGTIALVGLSVSLTLAWYGASDRLNIRSLDVEVAGGTDIKISTTTDADSFVADLDLTPNKQEFVFVPVSSMCRSDWMEQKSDTPKFYDCSSSLVPSSGEPALDQATYGFFQKKLYLRTNLDRYVTLDVDPESKYAFSEFKANDEVNTARAQQLKRENPSWTMSVSEIKEKLDSLEKCLRVSILVNSDDYYKYYVIDPYKDGDTYYGGCLDNDRDGYKDCYHAIDGKSYETIYGEVSNRENAVYIAPEDQTEEEQPKHSSEEEHYFGNSFEGVTKKGVNKYDEAASLANGLEIAKEESFSLDDINSEATKLLIPCYGGVPTEIVVSIYLEGWDLDCINATMGASFSTKLSFKLLRGIIG